MGTSTPKPTTDDRDLPLAIAGGWSEAKDLVLLVECEKFSRTSGGRVNLERRLPTES